jgi:hypothetical protein
MGDFNETMWGYEHFCESPRTVHQMEDFRDALTFVICMTLDFLGYHTCGTMAGPEVLMSRFA